MNGSDCVTWTSKRASGAFSRSVNAVAGVAGVDPIEREHPGFRDGQFGLERRGHVVQPLGARPRQAGQPSRERIGLGRFVPLRGRDGVVHRPPDPAGDHLADAHGVAARIDVASGADPVVAQVGGLAFERAHAEQRDDLIAWSVA